MAAGKHLLVSGATLNRWFAALAVAPLRAGPGLTESLGADGSRTISLAGSDPASAGSAAGPAPSPTRAGGAALLLSAETVASLETRIAAAHAVAGPGLTERRGADGTRTLRIKGNDSGSSASS